MDVLTILVSLSLRFIIGNWGIRWIDLTLEGPGILFPCSVSDPNFRGYSDVWGIIRSIDDAWSQAAHDESSVTLLDGYFREIHWKSPCLTFSSVKWGLKQKPPQGIVRRIKCSLYIKHLLVEQWLTCDFVWNDSHHPCGPLGGSRGLLTEESAQHWRQTLLNVLTQSLLSGTLTKLLFGSEVTLDLE